MVPPSSDGLPRGPSYSSSPTCFAFCIQGYHLLWPDFPDRSARRHKIMATGLFPVRSPLLRESRLISVPPGTEMFQFPGFASYTYVFSARYLPSVGGFPHSDIFGSQSGCRLPEAFRRLQRPSSPLAAKASTACTYSLDHIIQSLTARPSIKRHCHSYHARLNPQYDFAGSVLRLSNHSLL